MKNYVISRKRLILVALLPIILGNKYPITPKYKENYAH